MTHTLSRKVTMFAFLATSAVYFTNPLQAAEYQDTQVSNFSQLDTNKDTFIDRQEAANVPALLQIWTQVDANKDGKLSADEFSNLSPQK